MIIVDYHAYNLLLQSVFKECFNSATLNMI